MVAVFKRWATHDTGTDTGRPMIARPSPRLIHPLVTDRGDVDGLRAIAVIAVFLAGIGMPGTQGVFVGVDVLLVVVGFLVTSSLSWPTGASVGGADRLLRQSQGGAGMVPEAGNG
jgi:hypothetical protein